MKLLRLKGLFMLSTTDSSRFLNMKKKSENMLNNEAQWLTLNLFLLSRFAGLLSFAGEKRNKVTNDYNKFHVRRNSSYRNDMKIFL